VFLNYPFHKSYEELALASAVVAVCVGMRPRLVTEITHGEARVSEAGGFDLGLRVQHS